MAIVDLSSLITPSMVKIQLGVDNVDIKDEQIKESGLYEELLLDFYQWFPKVVDLINDTSNDEKVVMQRLAIKYYGKYFLCYKLALSGRLGFFQKLGDGENTDSRFDIDWDEMLANWQEEMDKMKSNALGIDTPMTPVKPEVDGYAVMAISTPAIDVVRQ